MKRFLLRVGLFMSPFLVYALVVVLVDPYDYFHCSNLIPIAKKEQAFRTQAGIWPVENTLWKMIHFRRAPCPNILLGDSRPYLIDPGMIEKSSGVHFCNLAIAGGYYSTFIKLFWFADSLVELKDVVIGVSFWGYHKGMDRDLMSEPEAVLSNPLYYFTRGWVRKSLVQVVKSWALPPVQAAPLTAAPASLDEATWRKIIETFTGHYAYYVYPEQTFRQLQKIAEYCRRKGIKLTLVVFPTYIDLQDRVRQFHLEAQRDRFLRDMASLAPVYDFNYPNAMTRDRRNFNDPFHANPNTMAQVVREVWGHQIKYAKIYRNGKIAQAKATSASN